MTNLFILPYRNGSQSVTELCTAMDGALRKIRTVNSKFKGSENKVVLNWGSTAQLTPELEKSRVLNKPVNVRLASNKLTFFKTMKDRANQTQTKCLVPNFTESKEEVLRLILEDGRTVFAREVLNGHSGEGIVEYSRANVKTIEDIDDAPLYVEYKPKRAEFRAHVFGGQIIFTQEKRRNLGVEDNNVNWRIRNHKNGFIFANQNLGEIEQVSEVALATVNALGLDFGAVDIIWNEREDRYYVLEVNTAPGITGSTLTAYADKLKEYA